MKCMKVPLEEAEVVKRRLINESLLDFNYKLLKEDGYIYYPVVHGILGYPTVEKTLEKKTPKNLKDALKKILTKNEILNLNTAFDTIGNIAVLEIVRSLEKKKKIIANELLKVNKNIKNYCGDVKKVMLKFEDKKFDRIVMPLPKDSLKFLKLAFNYLKKYGIIHLYAFSTEDDIHKKIKKIESDYNFTITTTTIKKSRKIK